VSPFAAFALLAAVTLLLFLLPFVPAIIELRRTGSIEPLSIPADYDGDVRHFARRFRAFVAHEKPKQPGENTAEYSARRVSALRAFVAPSPLVVDRNSEIQGDLYAQHSVFGWDGGVYRGLLADDDVALGSRSLVLRWIHGRRNLQIGASSALLGRASAEGVLRLDANTTFEWISAPRIEFGARGEAPPLQTRPAASAGNASVLPPRCVEGDLEIPANCDVVEDLIVIGSLRVGAGSLLRRSVKTRGDLFVEGAVRVRGSVVANGSVSIGNGCTIEGVVVAERAITIGARTRIGSQDRLSTVSAPRITVAPGAVAHGTVWARESGQVSGS
jgi:predicted acyltransferase (DUF342 family)